MPFSSLLVVFKSIDFLLQLQMVSNAYFNGISLGDKFTFFTGTSSLYAVVSLLYSHVCFDRTMRTAHMTF